MPPERKAKSGNVTKKLYDNRSPQRLLKDKAIMVKLLKEANLLTGDLSTFRTNMRKLVTNAPIPVHFNTWGTPEPLVLACSKVTLDFLKWEEKDVIDKPLWNFFNRATNGVDMTPKQIEKFKTSQQAYETMIKQGRQLPDTHVAVRFKGGKCYIVHFHREYIYSNDEKLLGLFVFIPLEKLPYQQFVAMGEDILLVEEEAFILGEPAKEKPPIPELIPEIPENKPDSKASEIDKQLREINEMLTKSCQKLGLVD